MKNFIKLKCFVCCVLLISCDEQKNSPYVFDPRNLLETSISLDEIADDILYIPLDNSYPISIVYNYYLISNSIYLSAKDIGVVIFNREGKLQKKVGAIGRGPGEYFRHTRFTVDDINGTIYIQDSDNRIKVYSKSGNFMRCLSFENYIGDIDLVKYFNSKLFLFNYLQFGNTKDNWIITDTLGHLIKTKERVIPVFLSNWGAQSGTYYFNNNLHYWNEYNDTVYKITPDLVQKTSFLLSHGDHRLPMGQFDPERGMPNTMLLLSVFETKNFFVLYYFFNKKRSLAVVEKKSEKSFLISGEANDGEGIPNNLDGGVRFLPSYYFAENNNEYMVGLLEPFTLKQHVSSESFNISTPKYPEKKKELEKLAARLKETDNPVLMLVRLKK